MFGPLNFAMSLAGKDEFMGRFGYSVVGLNDKWTSEDELAQLNEIGQHGGRLVSVITKTVKGNLWTFYYFIHEIPDPSNAEADNTPFMGKTSAK